MELPIAEEAKFFIFSGQHHQSMPVKQHGNKETAVGCDEETDEFRKTG